MIHPTALIDDGADLAADVQVGAYSVIGANVKIASGCWIGPHVVLTGDTRIGKNNRIFQFCSLGDEPQDMKYSGEETQLIIGDNNTIREFCTFNRGTAQGGGVTRIGNDNWIMAYVHIAHDCQLGSNTILANNACLAGHVQVDDWAILGGFALVHQHCTIGAHSFTSFGSHVHQSVPPYVTVAGEKSRARGINSEGLRRRGFSAAKIADVKKAYRALYRAGLPLEQAQEQIAELAESTPEVGLISDFLSCSQRNFIR